MASEEREATPNEIHSRALDRLEAFELIAMLKGTMVLLGHHMEDATRAASYLKPNSDGVAGNAGNAESIKADMLEIHTMSDSALKVSTMLAEKLGKKE